MNIPHRRFFAGLLAALAAASAPGQQVLVPPPMPAAPPSTAVAAATTNELENAAGPEGSTAPQGLPGPSQPFQWGPVLFHPRVTYNVTYGNGIQSQPGTNHNTVIQTVSPGIAANLGAHWKFDYAPTLTFYSDSHFHNAVDHSLSLSGNTAYEDWTFALSQSCSLSSDPQTETAQQTDEQLYLTTLTAGYQINGSLSWRMNINQSITDVTGFTGAAGTTHDWLAMNWLDQQWSPNLSAGIGAGFGYTAVDNGVDMSYEQLQGHASWQVTGKIRASANVGVEIRQFKGSSTPDLVSPVMGVSLNYHLFEFTTFSLNANRSVTPSDFQNQASETTTASLTVSQRFLKRYFVGLTGGVSDTTYHPTAPGMGGREDTYDFFSASLGTQFLRRGSASAFYSLGHNSSSAPGFAYESHQVGLQLSYQY